MLDPTKTIVAEGLGELAANAADSYGSLFDTEYVQRQLVPQIHNVDVFGGTGNQVLERVNGENVFNAGSGNEALSGGTSKNTFVFTPQRGNDIVANLRLGHDTVEIAFAFGGSTLRQLSGLLPDMSTDTHGDALQQSVSAARLGAAAAAV